MKKIKIKFDQNSVRKILIATIKYKRLLFIIFFGALLIFTFNTIYKNAYFNINYIDYAEVENFEISEGRKNAMLKKVIENIDHRKQLTPDEKNENHRNPFDFNDFENFDSNSDDDDEIGEDENNNPDALPTEPFASPRH